MKKFDLLKNNILFDEFRDNLAAKYSSGFSSNLKSIFYSNYFFAKFVKYNQEFNQKCYLLGISSQFRTDLTQIDIPDFTFVHFVVMPTTMNKAHVISMSYSEFLSKYESGAIYTTNGKLIKGVK